MILILVFNLFLVFNFGLLIFNEEMLIFLILICLYLLIYYNLKKILKIFISEKLNKIFLFFFFLITINKKVISQVIILVNSSIKNQKYFFLILNLQQIFVNEILNFNLFKYISIKLVKNFLGILSAIT